MYPKTNSIFLVILFSLLLIGCGTMEGAGRDIEGAGESIQKSTR